MDPNHHDPMTITPHPPVWSRTPEAEWSRTDPAILAGMVKQKAGKGDIWQTKCLVYEASDGIHRGRLLSRETCTEIQKKRRSP